VASSGSTGGLSSATTTGGTGGFVCPTSIPPNVVCQTPGCEVRLISSVGASPAGLNIAVDSERVYWAANYPTSDAFPITTTNDEIDAVSVDGGSAVALVSGVNTLLGIAIDATHLYWSSEQPQGVLVNPDAGALFAMALDGGPTVTLATEVSGATPANIVVDATSVFWLSSDDDVFEMPLDGGTPVEIVPSQEGSAPYGIAIDANSVYWTDWRNASVYKAPIGGGDVITLASLLAGLGGIAVDSLNVYWFFNGGDGPIGENAVQMIPIDGGTITTIATSGSNIVSLVADGTSVYWGTFGPAPMLSGNVSKFSLDAGTTLTLAVGANPDLLAVDATSVYWTSVGILTIPPPLAPPGTTCVPTQSYVMKLSPK